LRHVKSFVGPAALAQAEQRILELERQRQPRALPVNEDRHEDQPSKDNRDETKDSELTETDRHARVEAAFATQGADPHWKPEPALRAVLREASLAGASIRSVDCRSSMCRVETSHPDLENERAYVQVIAFPSPNQAARPFAAALFDEPTTSPDGREVRTVTYFTRPGFE
jgi:hypothetical protein